MPVYKDKQRGTWYISTSYTPKKGFYKKKTVRGFKKKSDALNYERVIMIQLKQKAKYNFVLGLKLEDVWKEYSDYMRLTEWKDSTYNANSCIYKKHIKPYFLGRDLLQIQKKEITEWHTALVKKGLSKPSINVIHTAFSGIYTYANDIYDIDYHPLSKVGYIKCHKEDKKKEYVILDPKDFVTFINSLDTIKMKLLFRTLYSTGLRITELRNLKWTNFKKQSFFINKVMKSENSNRIVPIDNELNLLLKQFKKLCAQEDSFTNDSYIFFGKHFNKMIPQYLIRTTLEKQLHIYDARKDEILTDSEVYEIEQYLRKLEIVDSYTVESGDFNISPVENNIITQSGLRYSQCKELLKILENHNTFRLGTDKEQNLIVSTIDNNVKGKILEELTIYNVQQSLDAEKYEVFQLSYPPMPSEGVTEGEIDLVIKDKELYTVELFEIKHSSEIVPSQYKHMIDPAKMKYFEKRGLEVTGRTVLYMGKTQGQEIEGVKYKNISEYLDELKVYDRNYQKMLLARKECIKNVEDEYDDNDSLDTKG